MERTIHTVLGEVSPSNLGIILPHEHVLSDFSKALVTGPLLGDGGSLLPMDLTMENLGLIRRFPYSVQENLILDDLTTATSELEAYKTSGGGTICEMSVIGMRRENHTPEDLVRIARSTGLHIISATGFYWANTLPDWVRSLSVREMADVMVNEVVKGEGCEGVRCGVMYFGCSHPLKDVEKKALQAAAITHKETGLALAISPGINLTSPLSILDYVCCHGVAESAVSLVHMDRTFTGSVKDVAKMSELCHRGCYINHSFFGKECSHYQYDPTIDMPSDAQRIQRVKALVDSGCEDRVLVSHDIVCKTDTACYGGHGYGHILENIIPKLRDRGCGEKMIDKLVKDNPKNWLTTCSN